MANTHTTTGSMTVKIIANDKGNPPGKLADAELHFSAVLLEGLKLIGFSVWERRSGSGRNVTFPARQYSVNGERRSFALLRPVADVTGQERIRDLVLEAYAKYESAAPPQSYLMSGRGAARRSAAASRQLRGLVIRPVFVAVTARISLHSWPRLASTLNYVSTAQCGPDVSLISGDSPHDTRQSSRRHLGVAFDQLK